MKNINSAFETLLIGITVIMGMCAVLKDFSVIALIWLGILGFLQVFHSLLIAMIYWSNSKIRTAIIIYWTGVIIYFSFFYFGSLSGIQISFLKIFLNLGVPLILALYLLWITYYFAEPLKKDKTT